MSESDSDDMGIFINEVKSGTANVVLGDLMARHGFLRDGLGNIHVERVEFRKSCPPGSPLEHEYLVVTVKESSGAGRRGYLLVERLNDNPSADPAQLLAEARAAEPPVAGTDSNSASQTASPQPAEPASTSSSPLPSHDNWETNNRLHAAAAKLKGLTKRATHAKDCVLILPTLAHARQAQGNCTYKVLMSMDFRHSDCVTLEDFLLLVLTTTNNTKLYHVIFAQCYWFAYTIYTVLKMATGASENHTPFASTQGTLSAIAHLAVGRGWGVNDVRAPATVKDQWEEAKIEAHRKWAVLQQAILAPGIERDQERAARQQAEIVAQQAEATAQQAGLTAQQERAARQQAEAVAQQERAARLQAEAEIGALRAMLQRQPPLGNVSTNI